MAPRALIDARSATLPHVDPTHPLSACMVKLLCQLIHNSQVRLPLYSYSQ